MKSKESSSKCAIPYGWHRLSGRMVAPTEVRRGRACECICAACGVRLKARQGDCRVWHFAHDEETNCGHAAEAAIHQMAKQMIADRATIYVPEKDASRTIYGRRRVWSETLTAVVQAGGLQTLEGCMVEKTVWHSATIGERRRPDVLAALDGEPLAIEILNTHAVDSEKLTWLRDQGHSVLEISVGDLSSLPIDQLHDALKKRLFEASPQSVWLAHANEGETQANLDAMEEQARHRWHDKENALIATLDAKEAQQRRREEFLKRVKDVEDFNLRIGRCTLRVGRNERRVSLKIHGHALDAVFQATRILAHKHRGQFNINARCWEFYRNDQGGHFFHSLCNELQRMDWLGAPVEQIWARSHATVAAPLISSPLPKESERLRFTNPDLQETFEERAGILEFDAGFPRAVAEQRARNEVSASLIESIGSTTSLKVS